MDFNDMLSHDSLHPAEQFHYVVVCLEKKLRKVRNNNNNNVTAATHTEAKLFSLCRTGGKVRRWPRTLTAVTCFLKIPPAYLRNSHGTCISDFLKF